jgi:glutamate dehydrogenase
VPRAQEDTGAEAAPIARAYTAAREIFAMRAVWEQIEKLDNKVPAQLQYEASFQTSRLLRHATYWLLSSRPRALQVDAAVREFRAGVQELENVISSAVTGGELARFEEARTHYFEAGLPPSLAARIASLEALNAALDIVELCGAHRVSVADAARVYFEVGSRIGFDWLRAQIEKLTVDGPWQAIARSGLRDGALRVQRKLTERVLARKSRAGAAERVSAWVEAAGKELDHWQRTLTDMRAAGASDFATLTVGLDAVRKLAS